MGLLNDRESQLFIDGKLVAGSGGTFPTVNPATEEVLGVAADENEGDMEVLNIVFESKGGIIYNVVNAESIDKIDILWLRRRDEVGPTPAGHLDGKVAGTADAAVDEYAMAALYPGMVEHRLPRCKAG